MARVTKNTRFISRPSKDKGIAVLIFQGVIVSLIVSFISILLLTLISLSSDNIFIDQYIKYIMVGITMVSIFIGSVYATQQAESRGLIIGIAIGAVFVLISIGFGLKTSQESIMPLVILNKFFAGVAAGALGGLIGVNL